MKEGGGVKLVYRKHRGGEQSPGEELQEDNHHRMVNTGVANPLWLKEENLHYQQRYYKHNHLQEVST